MNIFETEALLKESGVWSVNYLHVETEQLIVDLKVFERVWSRLKTVEGLGKNDVDCWGFWKTIRKLEGITWSVLLLKETDAQTEKIIVSTRLTRFSVDSMTKYMA